MSLRSPHEPADSFVVPEKKPALPPETKPDTWRPHTTPGFEVNRDGRLRANLPERKAMRLRGLGQINRRVTDLGMEKRCPLCREWWPLDPEFFGPNRARPDGFASECRACRCCNSAHVVPAVPAIFSVLLRPGAAA